MSRSRFFLAAARALVVVTIVAGLYAVAPAWSQTGPRSEAAVNASILIGEPSGRPVSGAELDKLTDDVASLIRCPVCQGNSVADSPSQMARDMKREVRDLLAAGYQREQVLTYFEKSYGEFIRLEPKAEGFNLVVWAAPVAALVIGIGVVAWRLGSSRASRKAPAGDREATADDSEVADSEVADSEPEDPELAGYLEQVRREVGS